ncbi:MAG: hypothetical protein ACI4PS_05035 [Rhodocyclaceae bacterium]
MKLISKMKENVRQNLRLVRLVRLVAIDIKNEKQFSTRFLKNFLDFSWKIFENTQKYKTQILWN